MNLLSDDWIPVELAGTQQRISLQTLLCDDPDCTIKTFRDDMDLAALQLLVCLVQVVFMPNDKKALKQRWQTPLTVSEYQQGIAGYRDWFDLLHPKTPFMQSATVIPEPGNKNWASLQKLFVGLPEKSSSSPLSSAFFDSTNEISAISLGDAAIALFQQATNGHGLGGVGFSVGLKGLMPLTTLIVSETLRKSLWCNVLSNDFLHDHTSILIAELQEPNWISPPHTKIHDERAQNIGLARGLFWQPAKVKLALRNGDVIGFYKSTGLCNIKDFWQHPHTPIDILKFKEKVPEKKPYLSIRPDQPLWEQMLSFFYTAQNISVVEGNKSGYSCALVVQQYQEVWRSGIKLAVGGYAKGKSTEKIASRKHELYSLSSGWETKTPEIDYLIKLGIKTYNKLDTAIAHFSDLANTNFKNRQSSIAGKKSHFKTRLQGKAKQQYFDNSETIMHSILRNLVFDDLVGYQKRFSQLAEQVFEQVISPYEHEDKMLEPVLASRQYLSNMLSKLNKPSDGATP